MVWFSCIQKIHEVGTVRFDGYIVILCSEKHLEQVCHLGDVLDVLLGFGFPTEPR